MEIFLNTIEGTTAQQAAVTVNRTPDGAPGPTISYIIDSDRLTILQETAVGGVVGHCSLSLDDLDVLSNNSPSEAAVHSLANRITTGFEKTSPAVFTGEEALHRFQCYFDSMLQDDAEGSVSYLSSTICDWVKRKAEHVDSGPMMAAEIILLDGGNSAGDSWKYTYYPKLATGLFLSENP